jgi:hypothetical protein
METQRYDIGLLFMAIMIAVTLVVTSCTHPYPADTGIKLGAPSSATYEVAFWRHVLYWCYGWPEERRACQRSVESDRKCCLTCSWGILRL